LKKQHLGVVLGIAVVLAAVVYVYYRWHHSGFAWQKFVDVLSTVDWSWLSLALALILATSAPALGVCQGSGCQKQESYSAAHLY